MRPGPATLEVIGGYDLMEKLSGPGGSISWTTNTKTIPLLVGESGPLQITLIEVRWTAGPSPFTGLPAWQELTPGYVLLGTHLAATDDAVFKSALIQVDDFYAFTRQTPLRYTLGDEQAATITGGGGDSVSALVDDVSYESHSRVADFQLEYERARAGVVARTHAVVEVIPAQPVAYDAFFDHASMLTNLLSLAMGQPCGLISMSWSTSIPESSSSTMSAPSSKIARLKRSPATCVPRPTPMPSSTEVRFVSRVKTAASPS